MRPESGPPHLPSLLVASDGRHAIRPPPGVDGGVVVRDSDLAALVHRARSDRPPDAVELDSVAGLGGDDTAVDFVTGRLGIRIVLTRRPALALHAAERGAIGLVHVFAYDSTGLARSLEAHPRAENVGSVVSPGLVLLHLRPDELDGIPRPIVAHGFIDAIDQAAECAAIADAIVVRPGLAARIAAAGTAIAVQPAR